MLNEPEVRFSSQVLIDYLPTTPGLNFYTMIPSTLLYLFASILPVLGLPEPDAGESHAGISDLVKRG